MTRRFRVTKYEKKTKVYREPGIVIKIAKKIDEN